MRGRADALLVTGAATGDAADPGLLREIKEAVPDTPVLVASGLGPLNVRDLLPLADGAIVGTCLKRGARPSAPVDRARCRRLMKAVEAVRR